MKAGNESMQCILGIWCHRDVQLYVISIIMVIDMVVANNISKWKHVQNRAKNTSLRNTTFNIMSLWYISTQADRTLFIS